MEQIPMDLPITFTRGDTFSFDVTLDGDQNLTVASMFFSARVKYDDTDYIFRKSIGDGITHTGEHSYRVRVAPEDTETMAKGRYYYDLQVGLGEGTVDIYTIIKGRLELLWDVTRNEV